jgi:integrase
MATVRKRNGKWHVQIRKKGYQPITETFIKKAVADAWANKTEADMERGTYLDARGSAKTSLTPIFDKYEAEITPTKAATSHVPEKARLKTLKAKFGKFTLAGLAPDDIVDFVKDRSKKVSGDSVRKELQLLADVINTAQALWGYSVIFNPVDRAKVIVRKRRILLPGHKRERRLNDADGDTKSELERLLAISHKRHTVINDLLEFAIETAMRRGELAAAKREHVDKKQKWLRIPDSKTDYQTGEKGRVIPLSSRAMEILAGLPARTDGYIFGMKPRSITQAFDRMCEDAKITGLRFHDLRHEATNKFFERGFTIEQVSAITGHKDWRSLKRYTHPKASDLAKKLA